MINNYYYTNNYNNLIITANKNNRIKIINYNE